MTVVSIRSGETSGRRALRGLWSSNNKQSVGLVLCGMPVGEYYTLRKGVWARAIRFLSGIPGWPSPLLKQISDGVCEVFLYGGESYRILCCHSPLGGN